MILLSISSLNTRLLQTNNLEQSINQRIWLKIFCLSICYERMLSFEDKYCEYRAPQISQHLLLIQLV